MNSLVEAAGNFYDFYNRIESLVETFSNRKAVITYGGRFQPFHKNHYTAYDHLVKKFKSNDVFITTSDKVELPKSPFNFKEKEMIMTSMFNIPKKNIVNVRNNYNPKEILEKLPEDTIFIVGVGEKDAERLSKGKYFKDFNKTKDYKGFKEEGYYYIIPMQVDKFNGEIVSGTTVRDVFGGDDQDLKIKLFSHLYGKFDPKVFDFLDSKIGK